MRKCQVKTIWQQIQGASALTHLVLHVALQGPGRGKWSGFENDDTKAVDTPRQRKDHGVADEN